MGWAGFQELYRRKDRFDIRLLARDSKKNHKKLDRYAGDPAVTVIWGDLTRYEDVLRGVTGSDYVLHVGGMVSPAADYYPEKTLKVNISSSENIVKAVLAQPNADEIKVVYIGSVAEYGNRMFSLLWGRTGDPMRASAYDMYSVSKCKAEKLFVDSGLKNWVVLRQTGILYPGILKVVNPTAFHVPVGGVLEWATVEDSGRLLANVCGDDIPEEFWRRFYNIGSGEEYRITNYEFEDLLLGTLGLGSPKKLFDPHWFTTRNFHGQWYYDGDELEKYCHFRANIPVKDYFKSMMDKVEGYYKLAFLAKPFAPILKKLWMKKIAETPEYGTLWWAANKVDVRMKAYYGSMEEYEKLPRSWDDFEIVIPSKKKRKKQLKLLNKIANEL